MNGCNFDRPRNMIPRWRKFADTVKMRELGMPPREDRREYEASHDFIRRHRIWRLSDAPVYTADLLSSALVAGKSEEVHAAAQQLLKNEELGASLQHLVAKRVIFGSPPTRRDGIYTSAQQGDSSSIRSQIAFERKLLYSSPDNPIAWTELAHAYTVAGVADKAERCLLIACQLAPHNRFVLRSATRFWIHNKDPEHSLWLLRRSRRLRSDPWLLAAEIATSTMCKKESKEIKYSQRLLSSERDPTIHFSELAASLGEIEFERENIRKARNLFMRALQQPTENAVAQAILFNRQVPHTKLENLIKKHLITPRSHEALALIRFKQGAWDEAVREFEYWLDDEPFSSRPAIDASYLAILAIEDHSRAERIALRGLRANPKDPQLKNNLAVVKLHMNQVDDAEKIINRLPATPDDPSSIAILQATRGLLVFRQGHYDLGAQLYLEAAEKAAKDSKFVEIQALFIGAIEAVNSGCR